MYENNYEMFLTNREIFDSKLPVVQAMHKEIDGITLYTGTNLYPHNGTLVLSIKSRPNHGIRRPFQQQNHSMLIRNRIKCF